jgi:nicotinate-nucleotide pyrophosphorylase
MKKELPWIRRLQKQAMKAAGAIAHKTSEALGEAKAPEKD